MNFAKDILKKYMFNNKGKQTSVKFVNSLVFCLYEILYVVFFFVFDVMFWQFVAYSYER